MGLHTECRQRQEEFLQVCLWNDGQSWPCISTWKPVVDKSLNHLPEGCVNKLAGESAKEQ